MAKRTKFEELMEAEFSWPQAGDQAFVVAADPIDNANIAADDLTRLVLMTRGYKQAADLMVEATEEDRQMRDFLVFPIVFNYRQFLELELKYQLEVYGPSVRVRPIWNSHNLEELWTRFVEMLQLYGTDDPDSADDVVASIVADFAKIDPGSFSHRYPRDTRGRPLTVARSVLHLPTLRAHMEKIENYFKGCDGLLTDRQSAMRS